MRHMAGVVVVLENRGTAATRAPNEDVGPACQSRGRGKVEDPGEISGC